MLHLILAESALELVPEALWSHPAVSKSAKQRAKKPRDVVLDDTFHHSAMKQAADAGVFPDLNRRGRPDIIHTTLLVALESRLHKAGRLRVWIHTRNDEWVTVSPEVRIPRNQHRFQGIVEQLLTTGAVPPGAKERAFLQLEPGITLKAGLDRIGAARVVVMDEHGDDDKLEAAFQAAGDDDVALVVGGFPDGRLAADLTSFSPARVALGRELLTAWAVAGEAIVRYHRAA